MTDQHQEHDHHYGHGGPHHHADRVVSDEERRRGGYICAGVTLVRGDLRGGNALRLRSTKL